MLTPRDLPLIAVFAAVARHRSFTAAARELGFTKSMVSAQVRSFEEKCGARLLDRTTRSVRLTSVGRAALEAAERMLSEANGVEKAVRELTGAPRGHLVVGVPHGLAATVSAMVASMVREHEGLTVELVANDEPQDLVQYGLDVVVRVGAPKNSTYVMRRLGQSFVILAAARSLGVPKDARPSDLASSRWVGHSLVQRTPRWTFVGPRGERETIRPAFSATANTMEAFRALIVAGGGVGAIPELHVAEELRSGMLERVCSGWSHRHLSIFALVAGRKVPAHAELLLETLRSSMGKRTVP